MSVIYNKWPSHQSVSLWEYLSIFWPLPAYSWPSHISSLIGSGNPSYLSITASNATVGKHREGVSRKEGEDFDSLLILSSFLYLSLQFLPTALTLLFSLRFLVLSPEVHIPLVSVCRTLMIPGYITDQTLCLFNLCRTRKKGIILLVARSFFYFLDISVLPSPPFC